MKSLFHIWKKNKKNVVSTIVVVAEGERVSLSCCIGERGKEGVLAFLAYQSGNTECKLIA